MAESWTAANLAELRDDDYCSGDDVLTLLAARDPALGDAIWGLDVMVCLGERAVIAVEDFLGELGRLADADDRTMTIGQKTAALRQRILAAIAAGDVPLWGFYDPEMEGWRPITELERAMTVPRRVDDLLRLAPPDRDQDGTAR